MPSRTLAQVRDKIDADLGRQGTINSEIVDAIQEAVRLMERDGFEMAERRHANIKLNVGQDYYASFSGEEPAAPLDEGLSEIPHSFDEPWYDGPVSSLIRADEAYYIDSAGQQFDICRLGASDFFAMRQKSQRTDPRPTHWSFVAQNIGVYPTPSASGYAFFFGRFKPHFPENDNDQCVFFDEGYDLLVSYAKIYLATHTLMDGAMVSRLMPVAESQRLSIVGLGNSRLRTGRIRPHW